MKDFKRLSICTNAVTRQQLDDLAKVYNSQTVVFAIAIERLWQQTIKKQEVDKE